MYIISTIQHIKRFVRYLRSPCLCIRSLTRSFAALACFISDSTTRCLAKYRPRTLSMKYSTCIIEKRSVTSRYHCSKIFRSLLDRDGHLHCRMMEENNRGRESHKCKFFRFFAAIFVEPRFVETQKFFYHGNVT